MVSIAGLAQRVDGVDAAIVELDALADAVRAAAQDDDLAAVGRLGLALGRPHAVALVAGIEVGRARFELGGAGVDALEHRPDAERAPRARRPRPSLVPVSSARRSSEKPFFLSVEQPSASFGQAVLARTSASVVDDAARSGAGTTARTCEACAISSTDEAEAEGLGDRPGCGRASAATARRTMAALSRRALDLDLVEAGQAGLHRAQRLLQRFLEGAADRHRLAHALHRGGEQRLGAGELLEGEARHLGDDVVDRRLERGRRRRR